MSRLGVLLCGAATLQNSPGWLVWPLSGWKLRDRESHSLMILSNRFSPRCQVTVEIPHLYLIPLCSSDRSLRFKLLRQRSRYEGEPKTYQGCNISAPAFPDQHILMLNTTTSGFPGQEQGLAQLQGAPVWEFRPWEHL